MFRLKFVLFPAAIFLLTLFIVACNSGNDNREQYLNMSMPLLTSADNHGAGVGWKRADCQTCHPISAMAERDHPRIVQMTGKSAEQTCVQCHLGNGVFNIVMPSCISCHTDTAVFGGNTVHVTGATMHTIYQASAAGMVDRDCIACHDNTDMNGGFRIDQDLSRLNNWDTSHLNNFCFTCHSASGAVVQNQTVIAGSDMAFNYTVDNHGAKPGRNISDSLIYDSPRSEPVPCLACHNQHVSSNTNLIIQSTADMKKHVNVNVGDIEIDAQGPDLRDLCASCHISNAGALPSPDSVPSLNGQMQVTLHAGQYCVLCHREGSVRPPSVYPVGEGLMNRMMRTGESCASCHKHGSNATTEDVAFPTGRIHAIF